MSKSNPIVGFFRGSWRLVDGLRRFTFNVLFLIIFCGVIYLAFKDDTPEIEAGSALVIAPQGTLVEQLTAKSFQQVIDDATGNSTVETLLKDVVDAINAAAEDDRYDTMVLNLNNFGGGRMTKLSDVAEAMDGFRAQDKRIIAIADNYSQDSYYLAAHADEIIAHRMGAVVIEGMGRYRMYYREGLDKLGIDVNVFKVGTFKSAVEPYLLDGMSDAAREANLEWLGDLWRSYVSDVADARGMTPAEVDAYAQDFTGKLQMANGNLAEVALSNGFVDKVMTRVEMRDYLIELVGEDEDTNSYKSTSMSDYLANLDTDRFGKAAEGDKVAVVVARGTILDGSQPAGTIGGDSTAALIRSARNDENVKAIILRVDSGGGSAFASEVIRRELEAAQAQDIKVIASMGSVAASGGYWISTSADQIWAHPTTITGSIGIFAMIPTYQRPLEEYLGIRVDGIGTTPIAGVRLDRELPMDVKDALQSNIEEGYRMFLQRVADARGMSTQEVDEVAQGRVWSGEDAHRLGLVDELGDLNDAIAAVAELAELGDDYTVSFVEKELEFQEQLLSNMMSRGLQAAGVRPEPASPVREMLNQVEAAAAGLAAFNDPNHVYAWSTIETD